MIVKPLTEHHLEFLSLKRGCRGSSVSTLFKMPHCCKAHATAHIIDYSHIIRYYSFLTTGFKEGKCQLLLKVCIQSVLGNSLRADSYCPAS